jgi:hypothetical protein
MFKPFKGGWSGINNETINKGFVNSRENVDLYDTKLSDSDEMALLDRRVMVDLLIRMTNIDKNNNARNKYVYDCMNETDPEKIKQINKDLIRVNKGIADYRKSITKMSIPEYNAYHRNIWNAWAKENLPKEEYELEVKRNEAIWQI